MSLAYCLFVLIAGPILGVLDFLAVLWFVAGMVVRIREQPPCRSPSSSASA